jgi:hypothetical protein
MQPLLAWKDLLQFSMSRTQIWALAPLFISEVNDALAFAFSELTRALISSGSFGFKKPAEAILGEVSMANFIPRDE